VAVEKVNFTDFENSWKINKKSYNGYFLTVVIRKTRGFILSEKTILWVNCNLRKKQRGTALIISMLKVMLGALTCNEDYLP